MPKNPFSSSFEDAFEQGVSTVKASVGQQVKAIGQSTQTQVTGQAPSSADQQGKVDSLSGADQFNEIGNNQQQNQQQDPQQQAQMQQSEAKEQQERQEKLAETREKLRLHQKQHRDTYFDPTFNRRPKEPTVQERLEQEEQQKQQKKMEELQEEKKKEEPIALNRAKRTAEMHRGASG